MVNRRQFMQRAAGASAAAVLAPLMNGCGSNASSTPDYSATIAAMTPYIEQQMANSRAAGLGIALVDDQRVVWARGFGYADDAQFLLTPVWDTKAYAPGLARAAGIAVQIVSANGEERIQYLN